ncbi:MAG: ABC transporter substrate-binding protein [Pseudomonadota bacterium]|nr:ABC transporter substrate-binding protein [Pseudomonadota bacterium]
MRFFPYFSIVLFFLVGCDLPAVNSPYSQQADDDVILYTSFSLRPKHLDPAKSYSSNEASFTGQIYEPPFQYHYLKRPYTLVPLTATSLPSVRYFNEQSMEVSEEDITSDVAYSVYQITIKPNILYQPHPAFAKNNKGMFLYHQLTDDELDNINKLSDFEQQDSRELIAEDYVYQIKRLAHPDIHSPILGVMSEYIAGLAEYADLLRDDSQSGQAIDLLTSDISGVSVIDRYTYEIKVIGKYPQLRYWLAMPFFAPVPWEADSFYDQAGLIKKNITLDWYPVGTGPYQLTENDPNSRMVLEKNSNYHPEYYPEEGEPTDSALGLLADKGKKLPFIDKVIFTLEKENTSYWNKFLQGYYDISGISSDSFDQAIQVASQGQFSLSDAMKEKGIALRTAIAASTSYIGFNMQDPIIGGYSDASKKLRQAISIAVDYEEYISIFLNGRGIPAQGPIPPGIFGYIDGESGLNHNVYDWEQDVAKRKSLDKARELLGEAGYPAGRSQETGEPLTLYYDVPASGPDAKAQFDWLRKQFTKLGLQLVIRSTDYNRFQDKMRTGQAQLFQWGWNADYPDPENFLFLLYGPNSKAVSGGENAANYQNDKFDHLFEQMRVMPDNKDRQVIIKKMLNILTDDSPWIWGFHSKQFSLYHSWNKNVKPNLMANNTIKYRRVDAEQRLSLQNEWNKPILWPLFALVVLCIFVLMPAWLLYRQKLKKKILLN